MQVGLQYMHKISIISIVLPIKVYKMKYGQLKLMSIVLLYSVTLQILGSWYETDWWPPPHWVSDTHTSDNYAYTIRRNNGKEGEIVFTIHNT